MFCAVWLGVFSSCGDDDDDDKPANESTGGNGGPGNNGNNSGNGGASVTSAGNGGSSGGGSGGSTASTVTMVQPVQCGDAKCYPPTNPLSGLLGNLPGGIAGIPMPAPCCLDESAGTCGVAASAGATCEAPAVADNRCPGINLGAAGGGAGMAGCCIDNACGLDGSLFGRGCVENSEAKAMLGAIPLIGTLLMVPSARACDAAPDDGDAGTDDAGTDDAGK